MWDVDFKMLQKCQNARFQNEIFIKKNKEYLVQVCCNKKPKRVETVNNKKNRLIARNVTKKVLMFDSIYSNWKINGLHYCA